ncbi:MAG: MMPL family transporter [Thermodesulfobacteriota bacterium]|nr:MMPL family transporter [Thermodesulfobacteriota bacterium]
MARRIAEVIIKYRVLVGILVLLGTLFFAYEMKNVRLYHDAGNVTPIGHPYAALHKKMIDVFGGANLVAIAMVVRKGDVLDPANLEKINRITEKISLLRGVVRYKILSIACSKLKYMFTTIDAEGTSFVHIDNYRKMTERVLGGDMETLSTMRRAIINDEKIYGNLVSKDFKGTVILCNFNWLHDYEYIFDSIKEITGAEEDANTEFHICGRPIELAYLKQSMNKILYIFGVAVAAMVLLLYIDFRSVRGVILPLCGGVMAVIWGMGMLGFIGFRIDVLSMTVPFLVLALAHGHSVQMMSRYYEELRRIGDKKEACVSAVAGLFRPACTSIITDSAAFASLALLPFIIVRSMSVVAATGILSILLTTFTFVPIILSYLPVSQKSMEREKKEVRGKIFVKMAYASLGKSRWVVMGVGLICLIIALIGTGRVKVGDLTPGSPNFWQDSDYNRAVEVLDNKFTGTNLYSIYIGGKEAEDLWNVELARDTEALQRRLERRPDVGYTVSYVNILKQVNRAMHDGDPRWEVLPTNRPMTMQFLDSFVEGSGPEDPRSFFELDFRQANIQIFMRDHLAETVNSVIRDTAEFLSDPANRKSDADIVQAAGLIGIYGAIIEVIAKSQISNIIIMLIVVLVFCSIAFRSISAGLIVFIPLVLGNFITFAVMGFGKIGLFIYTIPVAALGIGVGVDYSLYLISRLRDEMEGGREIGLIYEKAITTAGRAIFFTAATVTVGLLALVLSEIRFQAILGGMLAVVMMANMFSALLLLPSLLSWIKPKFIFRSSDRITMQPPPASL